MRFLPIRMRIESIALDPLPWIRSLIIVGVLFLSVYLARNASLTYLGAILGLGFAAILLRWPRLGLVALVVGTLVAPISISTGSQTPLNITVLLIPGLLGIWLANMIHQRKLHLAPSRTTLPLIALILSATISLIAGNAPWNLFARTAPLVTQIAGWAVFVFAAGTVLLVANQVNDQRWLQILTMLFLAIGGLYIVGRLGIPGFSELSMLMNQLGSDGSMFWVWLVALAFGQLLFNRKLNRAIQILLGMLVVSTMYVGFFLARDWASGWLPPMIALGTIVWFRSWRLGIVIGVIGLVVVLLVYPNLLTSLLQTQTSAESYSLLTRDVARQILVQQILPLSPIFGLGPANYYWYTPLYPILGWYVNFNSHNNYVDIIMQTGLLGLACFFWVIWELGLLGWRLRKKFSGDFAQGYLFACLGGLAGTLVSCWLADWLLPFVYNIGLAGFRASILAWFFLGGLVSLEQIARKSEPPKID
ncbi:hypothetical protein ANRL1_00888 [Anaerolineae bacterium]|nr:hypothetical protein ANRL1_00888 [Anaerolineae bacterium]